jgi:hypothetical protein
MARRIYYSNHVSLRALTHRCSNNISSHIPSLHIKEQKAVYQVLSQNKKSQLKWRSRFNHFIFDESISFRRRTIIAFRKVEQIEKDQTKLNGKKIMI